MKKIITLVATIMLLVTSTLALAGCGSTTLEDYVNGDSDAQQQLSDLESSLGEGGSVTIKDNNIEMIYKYGETYDDATIYQDASGTELYSKTYK